MKYKAYMNVIYETQISEEQTEPPYTFRLLARKLLEDDYNKEEKIYWCWRWMKIHIQGTNVSAQKVYDLFGERIKEIIVNRKIKAMEKDFV